MRRHRQKDIVAAIQTFYKNLTTSWHLAIPFPLDRIHAVTAPDAGGCLVRCRTLQKYYETIQRRSCFDDLRNYECSNVEYSMERSRRGTAPANLS